MKGASLVIFTASVPFLWISGRLAAILLAVSVFCMAPVPPLFVKLSTD